MAYGNNINIYLTNGTVSDCLRMFHIYLRLKMLPIAVSYSDF